MPNKEHRLAAYASYLAFLRCFRVCMVKLSIFSRKSLKSHFTTLQGLFCFFEIFQGLLLQNAFLFPRSDLQVIQPSEGCIQTPPPYPSGLMFAGYLLPTCSPVCTQIMYCFFAWKTIITHKSPYL